MEILVENHGRVNYIEVGENLLNEQRKGNKNVDIKFSVHGTFLEELPSSVIMEQQGIIFPLCYHFVNEYQPWSLF